MIEGSARSANWLIDAIVRQTLVLIARIATAGGQRAQVAQLADQVFLDLAAALESQGVSQKVIADMFGLALRSYQRKRRRLLESATDSGRSLWTSVLTYVHDEGDVSRRAVLDHFARDDEAMVGSVLSDLVASSLVFQTGHGPGTRYRPAFLDDDDWVSANREEVAISLVWITIFRHGPIRRDALLERLAIHPEPLDAALGSLLADGRVRVEDGSDVPVYTSDTWLIPYGSVEGWPAAIYDHFQAMVGALCAKLHGEARACHHDAVGGSTFTFDTCVGHPFEAEASGLLAEFRHRAQTLRARIDRHNAAHPPVGRPQKVVLYFGQNVVTDPEEDS